MYPLRCIDRVLFVKFLSKCVVGASLDGEEEAVGEEEHSDDPKDPKKPNTYKIYGTVKNMDEFKKEDFVKEIINVRSRLKEF